MGFLSQSFGIIDPHQNGMISIRKATHQFEHVSQENAKEYYDFYVYPTLGRSENRVKKHARGARDMGMPFWRVPTLNGSNFTNSAENDGPDRARCKESFSRNSSVSGKLPGEFSGPKHIPSV